MESSRRKLKNRSHTLTYLLRHSGLPLKKRSSTAPELKIEKNPPTMSTSENLALSLSRESIPAFKYFNRIINEAITEDELKELLRELNNKANNEMFPACPRKLDAIQYFVREMFAALEDQDDRKNDLITTLIQIELDQYGKGNGRDEPFRASTLAREVLRFNVESKINSTELKKYLEVAKGCLNTYENLNSSEEAIKKIQEVREKSILFVEAIVTYLTQDNGLSETIREQMESFIIPHMSKTGKFMNIKDMRLNIARNLMFSYFGVAIDNNLKDKQQTQELAERIVNTVLSKDFLLKYELAPLQLTSSVDASVTACDLNQQDGQFKVRYYIQQPENLFAKRRLSVEQLKETTDQYKSPGLSLTMSDE